jgi:hypothetical protein
VDLFDDRGKYVYTGYVSKQKYLIVKLTPDEHKTVVAWALELNTSISNLVRRSVGLPEVQRGRPRTGQVKEEKT